MNPHDLNVHCLIAHTGYYTTGEKIGSIWSFPNKEKNWSHVVWLKASLFAIIFPFISTYSTKMHPPIEWILPSMVVVHGINWLATHFLNLCAHCTHARKQANIGICRLNYNQPPLSKIGYPAYLMLVLISHWWQIFYICDGNHYEKKLSIMSINYSYQKIAVVQNLPTLKWIH